MKIFISWSGERSEALARALRDWFPLVLHYAQPWLSQSDIKAGDRWGIEVAKELENSNFGVICVTRENLSAPWILFEAGALAKSMQDGRVIPVLLDLELKDLSGPLAQFQAKKTEQAGMKELVQNLNKLTANPIDEQRLDKLFGMAWSDIETQIGQIPKTSVPAKAARPQSEILEELVTSIRNVDMRIRDGGEEVYRFRKKRMRLHPEMLHDLLGSKSRRHDPIRFVIYFSYVKEEFPWLFELALEAYRSASSGSKQRAAVARQSLLDAYRQVRRGHFQEMLFDDKYTFMFMREIEHLMEQEFHENLEDFEEPELSKVEPILKDKQP